MPSQPSPSSIYELRTLCVFHPIPLPLLVAALMSSSRTPYDDETRRNENRPTLPPIRDLFGRELSRPPRPNQGPPPAGYSPSAHFSQLSLPDEPSPYAQPGEQSLPGYSRTHTSHAYPHGYPHSLPSSQYPPASSYPGRHQTPAPSVPARSVTTPYSDPARYLEQSRTPQSYPGHTSRGRSTSTSTVDPYRYPQSPPQVDASQWPHRSAPYGGQSYPPQGQPVLLPSQQGAYTSTSRGGPSSSYAYSATHGSHGAVAPEPVYASASSPPERPPSSSAKYECSYCGKGFTRPSSLKIHLHSHTGERPYVCTVEGCGRTFSVQSNMRRHARTHSQSGIQARESSGEEEGEGSPPPSTSSRHETGHASKSSSG
ncbi:hypothetical protein EW146_g1308 [Bondarzewia mesenterica]|uniref:C2H2-type domain-containing protein n=1 Tax=Bondarzewia mesenterica TaxID=1095465 RepID=A0A4S4M5Q2_9AGAM|nr:hypothetical protein EW146_g1308 [Bondarzewia mesenterica]